jgi:hypothetical protein
MGEPVTAAEENVSFESYGVVSSEVSTTTTFPSRRISVRKLQSSTNSTEDAGVFLPARPSPPRTVSTEGDYRFNDNRFVINISVGEKAYSWGPRDLWILLLSAGIFISVMCGALLYLNLTGVPSDTVTASAYPEGNESYETQNTTNRSAEETSPKPPVGSGWTTGGTWIPLVEKTMSLASSFIWLVQQAQALPGEKYV